MWRCLSLSGLWIFIKKGENNGKPVAQKIPQFVCNDLATRPSLFTRQCLLFSSHLRGISWKRGRIGRTPPLQRLKWPAGGSLRHNDLVGSFGLLETSWNSFTLSFNCALCARRKRPWTHSWEREKKVFYFFGWWIFSFDRSLKLLWKLALLEFFFSVWSASDFIPARFGLISFMMTSKEELNPSYQWHQIQM